MRDASSWPVMIKPTETESKETLDRFVEVMLRIAEEVERSPETRPRAPITTKFSRFDEAAAARKPRLRFEPSRLFCPLLRKPNQASQQVENLLDLSLRVIEVW